MPRKKAKTVFAEAPDGTLYVKVIAIMEPFCALVDGLPMTFFGRGKTAYMTASAAIEWCQKEREYHSRDKYDQIIDVLERALAGNVEYSKD